MSRFGLDGSIGPPKSADYSGKIQPKGNGAPYGRMGIDGTFGVFDHDYSGKTAVSKLVSGGVAAQSASVNGNVDRIGDTIVSGGVQAQQPVLNGTVLSDKIASGGVTAQSASTDGSVDAYPFPNWVITSFTVDYAGLSINSPFYSDPTYSAIEIGDKCHFDTVTDPDSHTMSMSGDGEFTITPSALTRNQVFDFQIYDASDQSFGNSGTITVLPQVGAVVDGGVQSQDATVSGVVDRGTVVSGGVQSDNASVFGVLTSEEGVEIIVGDVQAQVSTVSGTLERVIKIPGIGVQPDNATVTGTLGKIVKISGGAQAQPPVLTGDLTPPTEEPGTADPRYLSPKFINRKIKWKTNQRKLR